MLADSLFANRKNLPWANNKKHPLFVVIYVFSVFVQLLVYVLVIFLSLSVSCFCYLSLSLLIRCPCRSPVLVSAFVPVTVRTALHLVT
jgi:hypothetical protein